MLRRHFQLVVLSGALLASAPLLSAVTTPTPTPAPDPTPTPGPTPVPPIGGASLLSQAMASTLVPTGDAHGALPMPDPHTAQPPMLAGSHA